MNAGMPGPITSDVLESLPYQSSCVEDLDFVDYLAVDAASSSKLKTIEHQSPAHLWVEMHTPRKYSDEMKIGTAVHCLVLTPDLFEQTVVEMPVFNLKTQIGRDDRDAFLDGLEDYQIALTPHQIENCNRCANAIENHEGAQRLLTEGRSELSIFWQDNETKQHCKARFDFLRDDGGAVDLKCTHDASDRGFVRTCINFEYPMQAGFYSVGHEHVFDESFRYWAWIAAEPNPPYGVKVHVCPTNVLRVGIDKANRALRQYAEAVQSGWWSNYPETIMPLQFPNHYTRQQGA